MDVLKRLAPHSALRRSYVREILDSARWLANGGEAESAKRLLHAALDYIDLAALPHKPFEKLIAEAKTAIVFALSDEDPAGIDEPSGDPFRPGEPG